jgi:TolB protein
VVVDAHSGKGRVVATQHRYGEHPVFLDNGSIVFSSPNIHRVPGSNVNKSYPGGTFIVNSSGAHMRRLFGRQELAASPDGRWFIAGESRGGTKTLVLLNAKGKVVRRLAGPGPSHSEYLNPHFSPNGKSIVYEQRSASDRGTLYLVQRNGSRRRRLTFGSESASEPSFSPDGHWIVFTRTTGSGPGGNVYALSVSNPNSVRKLGLSDGYRYPAWGPH